MYLSHSVLDVPVLTIAVVALGYAAGVAQDAKKVHVVVSPNRTALEQMAATECAAQFHRLFNAQVTSGHKITPAAFNVLVGSVRNHTIIHRTLAGAKLSDQGIAILSFQFKGASCLTVAGGSPVATLWAVYELGHRLGIRYLLRGDVYPKTTPKLGQFDITLEPQLRTRSWRTINDFAVGPESWGVADHRRLLTQLAKMKFNRILLSIYPWHPFVHYEFRGVKKQTAMLWFGERFRVDGDIPGRVAFAGAQYFENPDFAGKKGYEAMTAAGIRHVRGIITAAKKLGMSVALSISPLEFPREFATVLPGSKVSRGLKDLTIAPGPGQSPSDPVLKELVATKIRAYLKTYPDVDALYLTLPEFPEWGGHLEAAWRQLDSKGQLGDYNLDQLIESARNRNLIASGERGVRALKGNIHALAFLGVLFEDPQLLKRPGGGKVELVISQVDPALFPCLDRVLPRGAAALHFIDYTARRVVENIEVLRQVPADRVRSQLVLTLADDNVGILPQAASRRLGTLVRELQQRGWDGFSTRYWVLGELDTSVHFLSRAGFDPRVTPRSDHKDLFVTMTGNPPAAERLWLGQMHLEDATELIDRHDLGFAFPVKGLLLKHYVPKAAPAWWKEMKDHYSKMMVELYRSEGAVGIRAQKLLFYYAKRGEYVAYYLGAVEAVRAAALAREKGDLDTALEQLETAIESMYDAITTLGDIARDPSDRGLIAVLGEHAYRPLVAEYERVQKEAEAKAESKN